MIASTPFPYCSEIYVCFLLFSSSVAYQDVLSPFFLPSGHVGLGGEGGEGSEERNLCHWANGSARRRRRGKEDTVNKSRNEELRFEKQKQSVLFWLSSFGEEL